MIAIGAFRGVPYSGPGFCAVLVARVLAAHGIPYPRGARDPSEASGWVRVEKPRPLDVVVFNVAGAPGHVGVCLGGDRFLHVEEGGTSRIERLSSPLHAPRIEGFYHYQGDR